jgi:diacylglycerol kinase (ATP)
MRLWFRGVLKSFKYASEGVVFTLVTQRNMQIHFAVAFFIMVFCLVLDLSRLEIILVFVAIVMVIAAELVNTAIESVVDLYTDQIHPLAKIAKDTAAAAVMLTGLNSIIVGLLVFYDKIWPLRLRSFTGYQIEQLLVAFGPLLVLFFASLSIAKKR